MRIGEADRGGGGTMGWRSGVTVLAALLAVGCFEPAEVEKAACALPDHPCPEGYTCLHEQCFPTAGGVAVACLEDGDCPAGVCLREAHVCVGCQRHSDCVSRLCHVQTHICVGCKADYQCPSGVCDESTGVCEISSTSAVADGK